MNDIIIQEITGVLDRLHESIASNQYGRIDIMHDSRLNLRELSIKYPHEFNESVRTWCLESLLVKRPHLVIAARILRYYTALDDTEGLLLPTFLEELINKFEMIYEET